MPHAEIEHVFWAGRPLGCFVGEARISADVAGYRRLTAGAGPFFAGVSVLRRRMRNMGWFVRGRIEV
jgi:hypothetical protein